MKWTTYLTGHVCWVLLLVAVLPFQGCQKSDVSELAQNQTVKTVFSPGEIQDLEKILDFFETQICDLANVSRDSLYNCYQAFFKTVGKAQTTGVIYVPIPYAAQQQMYKELKGGGFNEIWMLGIGLNKANGETIERMRLNPDGKWMKFLDELSRQVTIMDAYTKSFREERAMSSLMIENVLYNYHLYNMHDVRMRLFVAIHYLTLNDIYSRKAEQFRGPDEQPSQ